MEVPYPISPRERTFRRMMFDRIAGGVAEGSADGLQDDHRDLPARSGLVLGEAGILLLLA